MDAEIDGLTDKLREQVQVCLCKESLSQLDGDDSWGSYDGAHSPGSGLLGSEFSNSELGVL